MVRTGLCTATWTAAPGGIIEDPMHQDSTSSQLIQLADLVAWSANACADRHARNAFAHDWYSTYLAPRDIRRVPLPVEL